jgi:hypothetical protein
MVTTPTDYNLVTLKELQDYANALDVKMVAHHGTGTANEWHFATLADAQTALHELDTEITHLDSSTASNPNIVTLAQAAEFMHILEDRYIAVEDA